MAAAEHEALESGTIVSSTGDSTVLEGNGQPNSTARHDSASSTAAGGTSSVSEAPLPPPPIQGDEEPENSLRVPPAPHKKRKHARAPPKSILKQPAPRPVGFNFRRDWLQPLNSRLAYAAATATATPSPEALAAAGAPSAAIAPGAGLQNAAAGFWGNALKKLSGVTAAAAGLPPVPPPKRDLADDAPSSSTSAAEAPSSSWSSGNEKGDVSSGAAPASYEAAAHAGSPILGSATTPAAAPHQPPPRGPATSSTPATSPYATVKATAAPTNPVPPAPPPLSVGELKRVRFRMATLKVVYPINGPNGPLAPYEENLTKKRINMEHRALRHKSQEGGDARGWTGETLGRLYAECCRTREEKGVERVRRAFKDNPRTPPKVLDLSNELLSHGAVEALADLISVDWGLKKLVLESCGLDDESLRPLLHALLVSGSIPTISLANNKRIKARGWKFIAVFIRKARFLRYLDVSENTIDKKAADHLVQALTPRSGPAGSSSLDQGKTAESGESAKAAEKEQDLPDNEVESDADDAEPLFTIAPLLKRDDEAPETATVLSIRLENCGLKGAALEALAHGVRPSGLKHISIRRNRITALGAVALAIMIRDYPLPTDAHHDPSAEIDTLPPQPGSSPLPTNGAFESGNSVSARLALQAPYTRSTTTAPRPTSFSGEAVVTEVEGAAAAEREREAWRNSEARNKLRKQIEELPRTGSLLTLDVKGNDIRNGVTYIAQVLKRNRTLKVLNLSENKIDMQGLVTIAEALKFNSTLETLDMSSNPCCGPGLEGITTLRAAITINSNLKRVFLNSTDLSSEGAIALAEFLPEATSLIHLDLTGNFDIDIAGVLALSVSMKMNNTLRCLDLNIPPNDPDFARLSQEILQCCIRNTEQAQEEATTGGKKITVSAPILKSAVARDLKTRQEAEERQARRLQAQNQSRDQILLAAEGVRDVLNDLLTLDEAAKAKGVIVAPSELLRDTLVQAQLAEAQIAEAVAATRQGDQKDRALTVGDQLTSLLDRAKAVYEAPSPTAPLLPASRSASNSVISSLPTHSSSSPISAPAAETQSSPGFTIADSDDESDSSRPSSPTPRGARPSSSSSAPSVPRLLIPTSSPLEVPGDASEEEALLSPRSPIGDQSRSLTLEEGEVFRKGAALGTGEVDESCDEGLGDVSGEELKKEILDTPIARSPRPSFSGGETLTKPSVPDDSGC